MPALWNDTSTRPNRSTVIAKSRSTWSASLTSTATNSPSTSRAAAVPVSGSRSAITMRAPSVARRRAEASPMPLPPPVITATRPARRGSEAFEATDALPVGHRRLERRELHACRVRIVGDDVVAERGPGDLALLEQVAGGGEGRRHARRVTGVRVPGDRRLERELVLDPVQSRREQRGDRDVGVHVAAGHARLDVHRWSVTDDPERARAVVEPPCHRGGSEAAGHEPLVRIDVGSEAQRELPQARELSGEEVLHQW